MKTKIEVDIREFDSIVIESLKFCIKELEEVLDENIEHQADIDACKRLIELYTLSMD